MEWCKAPDVGLPAPDLVFLLKLSAEAAEQRAQYGQERYERTDFQQEVDRQFELLMDESWHVLDASRDIDSLHAEVVKTTGNVIKNKSVLPVSKLWKNCS